MLLLAWYYPKLAESAVSARLLLVAISAIVIVMYARQRWGLIPSAVFVGVGSLVGAFSLIIPAFFVDLQGRGDFYREVNQSSLPDWFFVVFIELDVGYGMLYAAAGILGGWLALEISGFLWSRWLHPRIVLLKDGSD